MTAILNLERLMPLYEGEPEALGDLMHDTLAVTSELIGKIESGLGSQHDVGHAAHELKGVSRTTGAEELAEIGEAVESLAKASRWGEISEKISLLHEAHRRLVKAAAEIA